MRHVVKIAAPLTLLAFLPIAGASAGDGRGVIVNEVHYNPFLAGSESAHEFIELRNLDAIEVDLGGWRVAGDVEWTFPSGACLPELGYVVVSPDPDDLVRRTGISQVFGPYTGRLDNGGGVLELLDRSDRVRQRLHYDDEDPWPRLADGLGPSLELTRSDSGNDLPSRWRPSAVFGGTPGAANSRLVEPSIWPMPRRQVLRAAAGIWRAFRGLVAPSVPDGGWAQPDFDDTVWEELAGPFGYGDEHGLPYTTTLAGMQGTYTTLYVRGEVELDLAAVAALRSAGVTLRLVVSFDDAWVAYLNGVEVGRGNAGTPGVPLAHTASANSSRTGEESLTIAGAGAGVVGEGRNVVAVQGLNHGAASPDFYLSVELLLEEPAAGGDASVDSSPDLVFPGVLNEVRPALAGGSGGFIELFNPTAGPLDAGGLSVLARGGELWHIPAGTELPPGGWAIVPGAAGPPPRENEAYVLLMPDGRSIADVLAPPAGLLASGRSHGRLADGGSGTAVFLEPTPLAANRLEARSAVIVSEVYFHPPYAPPPCDSSERCSDLLQWIELHNRGVSDVPLAGWRLTGGVEHDFGAAEAIEAGGYLVVAAAPESFRARYPEVARVTGGWSGRLSHGSDVLELRDALGNTADRVRYGDGGPLNDESPADGIDDRTLVASAWPTGADGEGASIELVHPALENALGGAWRASVVVGGTPGAPNSASEAAPPPVIGDVVHTPLVPRSSQAIEIRCRVAAVTPLDTVVLSWSLDGVPGVPRAVLMTRDDGGGAGLPSHESQLYQVELPPLAEGALLRWRISARDMLGHTALVPEPPPVAPYPGADAPYFLLEVDDSQPPPNGARVFRLLMTRADREALQNRPPASDVLLPGALIAGSECRQVVGVRYRGESSRRDPNRSFRVELSAELALGRDVSINLLGANDGVHGSSTARELVAMDLLRRSGDPYALEEPVTLHFPGAVSRDFDSRYVLKEDYSDAFLERSFAGAAGGSLYRALSPLGAGGPSGDLSYLGADPAPYRALYSKRNRKEDDDYAEIVALTRAFDRVETPDAMFADAVDSLVDASEWARFFAAMACLANADGGLWSTSGEDYFLYRVPAGAARADAGKWLLLAWDVEETFVNSSEVLFRPEVLAVRRFLSEPRFAVLYYEELDWLRRVVFARGAVAERFAWVRVLFPPEESFDVIDPIDAFVTRRLGYFAESIPERLSFGAVGRSGQDDLAVAPGQVWRYARGRRNPPGGLLDWTQAAYDDSAWEEGPSGFGIGDGDDATVLGDMVGSYTTVYVRRLFAVPDRAAVQRMVLVVDYDDAYVAYLNGLEIARSPSAPPGPVVFDATALAAHEASGSSTNEPDAVDVSFALARLAAGDNVLAVVGLNQTLASGDFTLIPSLALSRRDPGQGLAGGCGTLLYAEGASVQLRGFADPVRVRAVRAGGVLADLSLVTSGPGPFGAVWEAAASPVAGAILVSSHADSAGSTPPLEEAVLEVRGLANGFVALSGDLAGETLLAASGGPYRLSGEVRVPAGSVLRIEAGTVLLGTSGAALVVDGRLLVEGTESAPVVFRSFACDGPWGGIVLRGSGAGGATTGDPPDHVFACADISGGQGPQGRSGLINVERTSLAADGCRFHSANANAIEATEAVVSLRACLIADVYEGLHGDLSTLVVSDSRIERLTGDRDAIDLDGDGPQRSRIERCFLADGTDDGIDAGQSAVEVRDCVFRGFADKAISLEGNGPEGSPAVSGCVVYECGTGLAIKDGADVVDGHHLTITRSGIGLYLLAKDGGADGGHGMLHSVIVWGNECDVVVSAGSSLALSHSDAGGEAPWPGPGNVAGDPLFTAPRAQDVSLSAGSPCIGAGLDGSDMGALPYLGPAPPVFVRGDSNESGRVDISDAVRTLGFLFLGSPASSCRDRLDANDDGRVDITDAIRTLGYLFLTGAPLPPPFPAAGTDPTPDAIPCE